jgi:hypothetical protein
MSFGIDPVHLEERLKPLDDVPDGPLSETPLDEG